jgi:hypothetical protein
MLAEKYLHSRVCADIDATERITCFLIKKMKYPPASIMDAADRLPTAAPTNKDKRDTALCVVDAKRPAMVL